MFFFLVTLLSLFVGSTATGDSGDSGDPWPSAAPLLGRQLDPIEDRGRGKPGAHREDADATALRLDGAGVENESSMVRVYIYIWLFIYLFIYLLTFWS